MGKNEKKGSGIFTGAGYLTGLLIGAVAGVLVVKLTGIHGLIGAISAAIAIPSGYLMERKFQKEEPSGGRAIRRYIAMIISGVILFFICFFILK